MNEPTAKDCFVAMLQRKPTMLGAMVEALAEVGSERVLWCEN